MLQHLDIHQFAVVESLALDFEDKLSVLTGETGAGKSILFDALALLMGERSTPLTIRPKAQRAELSASFVIKSGSAADLWLKEHSLEAEGECILRRQINREGASRAFINGRAITSQQLRNFAPYLVSIHGQHQHQQLLKNDFQLNVLDAYAQHPELLAQVSLDFHKWQTLSDEKRALQAAHRQKDKLALLEYQLEELQQLNLGAEELGELEQTHKQLAQVDFALQLVEHAATDLTGGEHEIINTLIKINRTLNPYLKTYPALLTVHELIATAIIQCQEALIELEGFAHSQACDPEHLAHVDARLSIIHQLARKHRVQAHSLYQHQASIQAEAEHLQQLDARLNSVNGLIEAAYQDYLISARTLSQSRARTGELLSAQIAETMCLLEMPHGRFAIEVQFMEAKEPRVRGADMVEFKVSTNPGMPLQALRSVASGGELSRISLSIEVITQGQKTGADTLIFDEVDVGISGKTADTVGRLLSKLGQQLQVLCVTHLPQVACYAQQHYQVTKQQTVDSTHSHITKLDGPTRVEALAQLLGGAEVSRQARAQARALLKQASLVGT